MENVEEQITKSASIYMSYHKKLSGILLGKTAEGEEDKKKERFQEAKSQIQTLE